MRRPLPSWPRWSVGVVAAAAALLLPGCARPSERITTALIAYGMPEAPATCVGARLERDLSLAQLRELSMLVRTYRQNDPEPDRLTSRDFIRVASQVRDPRVPIAAGRAAAACGLLY